MLRAMSSTASSSTGAAAAGLMAGIANSSSAQPATMAAASRYIPKRASRELLWITRSSYFP